MESELEIMEERGVHAVLIQLMETPGLLRTEVCRKMEKKGMSEITVTKRINELIMAGLITWEQSKTHKKGQNLFLTEKGKKVTKILTSLKEILEQ